MSKGYVTARIDGELKVKLEEIVSESGDSMSRVVERAIASYLKVETPESTKAVVQRLTKLEKAQEKLFRLVQAS